MGPLQPIEFSILSLQQSFMCGGAVRASLGRSKGSVEYVQVKQMSLGASGSSWGGTPPLNTQTEEKMRDMVLH
jgi:hypothetical protein